MFGWYAIWPDLDIPMHCAGGVAITRFLHRAAVNAARAGGLAPFHAATHLLLVVVLAGSSTVVWEFAEFVSDRHFGTHAQGGLHDTLLDMALGCGEGIALLAWLALRARLRTVSLADVGASPKPRAFDPAR